MIFCQTAWQFYLLSHLYVDGVNLNRCVCFKLKKLLPNGKLDIGGAWKWHFVLVFRFLKKFSMKITLTFIWAIVYFCTMDGFFRILNKALSKLTCTWLYFDFLPRRLYYWYSRHIHKQNPLLWPCVLKVVYTKKENAFLTYSVGFYIQSFVTIGIKSLQSVRSNWNLQ